MEMLQYRPWEKEEVNSLINNSTKKLEILDIQLGGSCNLNCIYCDTPKYGYPCNLDILGIHRLLDDGDIKWVYICGLGEPTSKENLEYLKSILLGCKYNNIKVSIFSNMLNLDDELLKYIDDGTLHVLFKLDTFDKDKMKYLYGKDKGDLILKNYDLLNEVCHSKNGTTNLGASIVPSGINYDELPKIIDYCIDKGIFPLIGQLEDAGKCSKIFNKLKVNDEDLNKIKNYISNTYGVNYEMPICPATISGIHITNNNKVIVDKKTGLSCPWFWLDEPELKVVGDITFMSYKWIVENILMYRYFKFNDVIEIEKNIELYPFGGCGGNVKKLLKTYIDISNN